MSRLQEQYKSEIQKNLYSKLNCNNIHEVPKISKIVLNIGLGEAKDDTKIIDKAQQELSLIAGQKAVKTKAKKGLTVMWPAEWTHTHKGIISPDKEKYIATGWLNMSLDKY